MSSPDAIAPQLLERESEVRALEEAVGAAAAGSGRLVVIEGEAGIGKSTLLHAALERAVASGLRPLKAVGSELERDYPFGIATALFEPIARERARSAGVPFAGPAARVAPLFGQGSAADPAPGDPVAIIHGLYWLTLDAIENGPIVIAVDDAQWADDGSLRFLHHLAQRIRELPIILVLAFRSGDAAADDETGRALRGDRAALLLRPAPLSEAAVAELLTSSRADTHDPSLPRACWDATHGNPFFVTELIRELERREDDDGVRSEVARTIVPASVMRFVEGRIVRLDQGTQRVAEAVAVLDEAADLRHLARFVEMPEREVVEAVRELSRAAILDDGPAPAFAHPLVRRAVYDAIPAVARAHAHRDVVLMLLDEGAAPAALSGQLLESERAGDPRIVEALMEAGRDARSRGQPRAAARLLRRGLEEPPAAAQRQPLLVTLARAEADAGDAGAAAIALEEALGLTSDRCERAALLLELGHALVRAADHARATETFTRGLAELDDPDDPLHARLESGLVSSGWMAGRHDAVERITARILSADSFGPVHRELVASVAFQLSIGGSAQASDMLGLIRRVLDEAPIEVLISEGQLIELANGVLFSTDELDWSVDMLSRSIDAAQATHVHAKIGLYSVARSWAHYFGGRLLDAIADTDAGIRAAEVGWEAFYPVAVGVQAMAHIERAELAAAQQVLDIGPDPWSGRADWLVPLIARARLLDASSDAEDALGAWQEAAAIGTQMGYRNPGPSDWRTWLALALARRGEREEARRVAQDALDVARHWGARWPIGAALRVMGIVEGGPTGLEHLREAVAILEGSPAHLERTRALVDLGMALRRRGRLAEAREVLLAATDLAQRLDARALLARAREESRAAGARPRRHAMRGIEALTPSEKRVVSLAAAGRTNRQIAEELFVTPKSVEFHLGNAYGKLGIRSRRELPEALETSPAQEAGSVG